MSEGPLTHQRPFFFLRARCSPRPSRRFTPPARGNTTPQACNETLRRSKRSATRLRGKNGVNLFEVVEVVAGDELGEAFDAFLTAFAVYAELLALLGL